MQIHIAAPLRRREYAEALTELLERDGHQVYPFPWDADAIPLRMAAQGEPGRWLDSAEAAQVCRSNLEHAVAADLVVYVGGGPDTWAVVGAAVGAGVPVWGIRTPAELIGINRHMVDEWFDSALEIREALARCQAAATGAKP